MKRGDNMASKKKPLTPLQQEYRQQRRRIQQFIRRAEKRGYVFDKQVLPDKPKRITKQSVERLKKRTPDTLYKKARYGGEATYGEIVSGEKGRKLERKRVAEKAAETRKYREALRRQPEHEPIPEPEPDYSYDTEDFEEDYSDYYEPNEDTTFFDRVVIQQYKSIIVQYNQVAANKLRNWIDAVIANQGEHATAVMLQGASEAGVHLERKQSYSDTGLNSYIAEMMNYLVEAGDFTKAEIMEAMEYEESYEEPL